MIHKLSQEERSQALAAWNSGQHATRLIEPNDEMWGRLDAIWLAAKDYGIDKTLEIYERAFENNWVVQDAMDAIRALKSADAPNMPATRWIRVDDVVRILDALPDRFPNALANVEVTALAIDALAAAAVSSPEVLGDMRRGHIPPRPLPPRAR